MLPFKYSSTGLHSFVESYRSFRPSRMYKVWEEGACQSFPYAEHFAMYEL